MQHELEVERTLAPDTIPEHERVYRAVRKRILDGSMAPGDSVTIRGLAEIYGVSMTPARDAVRRLIAERALAMSSSGRASVPLRGPKEMADLFHARLILEPELAVRAGVNMTAHVIHRMREANTELLAAADRGDPAGYTRANTRFHCAIYEQAGAPALLALVSSVWLQTAPLMRQVFERLSDGPGLEDFHVAAIDAAVRGDADALGEAVRQDVAQGAELVANAQLDGDRI